MEGVKNQNVSSTSVLDKLLKKRIKTWLLLLFDIHFHKIQPGGINFSIHIAINGKVEDIIAYGKDRIQHVE